MGFRFCLDVRIVGRLPVGGHDDEDAFALGFERSGVRWILEIH